MLEGELVPFTVGCFIVCMDHTRVYTFSLLLIVRVKVGQGRRSVPESQVLIEVIADLEGQVEERKRHGQRTTEAEDLGPIVTKPSYTVPIPIEEV